MSDSGCQSCKVVGLPESMHQLFGGYRLAPKHHIPVPKLAPQGNYYGSDGSKSPYEHPGALGPTSKGSLI